MLRWILRSEGMHIKTAEGHDSGSSVPRWYIAFASVSKTFASFQKLQFCSDLN